MLVGISTSTVLIYTDADTESNESQWHQKFLY